MQTNTIPESDDAAFQQRLLVVTFNPLVTEGIVDFDEWKQASELLSACYPDFQSLLVEGRLDSKAIRDCTAFLEAVLDRKRDRNCNSWGIMLYYMLQLNHMLQCTADNEATIAWVVQQITSSALDRWFRCKEYTVLERFVIAVHKVKHDTGCNPLGIEARTIHWHNYRENVGNLPGCYAIRLDSMINVINTVTGSNFKRSELMKT